MRLKPHAARCGHSRAWPCRADAEFRDGVLRLGRVEGAGVTLQRLTGDDIKPHHWDSFYRFYLRTTDKKFGRAYLTREFFDLIGQTMADQVRTLGYQGDRLN